MKTRIVLPIVALIAILGVGGVATFNALAHDTDEPRSAAADLGEPKGKPDPNEPNPNVYEPITTKEQAIALTKLNPRRLEAVARLEAKLTRFGAAQSSLSVLSGRTRQGEAAIDANKPVWVVAVAGKVYPDGGPNSEQPGGGVYPWMVELYDAQGGGLIGVFASPTGVWPLGFDAIVDEAVVH